MQLHIKRPGKDQNEATPRGYAPLDEVRPIEELLEESFHSDGDLLDTEKSSWKTSRVIPAALFVGAILLLLGIVFFAREFQSGEPLQSVRVEGNHELMTSEVLSLASIDKSHKFYDIDLKGIEQRVAKHGLIRQVSIRRETHPNTIVIHIDERTPIAMIRSASGDPILVDNDFRFFLPKKLSGLLDPNKLLAVPVLTGITEKDTVAILEMSHIVHEITTTGDSSLREAIGELRRAPTGAYVIYTSFSMTPIFIGSPSDVRFMTTLERDTKTTQSANEQRLFDHQIQLLAKLWKQKLRNEIWSRSTLYVDARFNGQIIVHRKEHSATVNNVVDSAKRPIASADQRSGVYTTTAGQ